MVWNSRLELIDVWFENYQNCTNMKKVVNFLCCITLSLIASAQSITMDLSTAVDANSLPIDFSTETGNGFYDITDVWDSTYNDGPLSRYVYTNKDTFALLHLPSENAWSGMSWEGFTISQVDTDTMNVFGCVAKGGVQGEGTPYAIGYYSDYVSSTLGYASNMILFNDTYYPEYVYICQNSNTLEAVSNGLTPANKFTEKDSLILTISGIDDAWQDTQHVDYFLALGREFNQGWVKVDLSSIGATKGLSFRIRSTDVGQWGTNTPTYFALDQLTVNQSSITGLPSLTTQSEPTTKVLVNGRLLIIRNGITYTLDGNVISEH